MSKESVSPPRCASCGAAIALDELEHTNAAWASRQNFDDWYVVPHELEHVRNATFVGLHPSFAAGVTCPSCRYPFSIGDVSDGYANPFDEEDAF